jgi:hypothetical protein
MTDQKERPFPQETKRLLNAMIYELQPAAAQQALYAIVAALAESPRINKDTFQEIIDDARSYSKLLHP